MFASAVSGWMVSEDGGTDEGARGHAEDVSAPMTPSARGRAGPSKRCEAAAVASGNDRSTAHRLNQARGDSAGRGWARPASSEPTVNTPSAARKRRRAPHRSVSRPASGIVTT